MVKSAVENKIEVGLRSESPGYVDPRRKTRTLASCNCTQEPRDGGLTQDGHMRSSRPRNINEIEEDEEEKEVPTESRSAEEDAPWRGRRSLITEDYALRFDSWNQNSVHCRKSHHHEFTQDAPTHVKIDDGGSAEARKKSGALKMMPSATMSDPEPPTAAPQDPTAEDASKPP